MLAARVETLGPLVGTVNGLRGLDIGGQAVNGDARSIFGNDIAWDILDIVDGPGVTVVADATDTVTWLALSGRFDVVLCTEVLEHVEQWPLVLDCAAAALRPGGTLIVTCASTHRPPHGANGEATPDGQWYGNVAPEDLTAALTERFVHCETKYQHPPGDAYAWAYAPRGIE